MGEAPWSMLDRQKGDRMTFEELTRQTIFELPDRELLGAFISLTGQIEISVLEHLLNNSFRDWHISVLNDNSVNITVQDNLTGTDLNAFCTEAVTALSAQCSGTLI
jgi:hypothetical protein